MRRILRVFFCLSKRQYLESIYLMILILYTDFYTDKYHLDKCYSTQLRHQTNLVKYVRTAASC
jgi:hypothetical protein